MSREHNTLKVVQEDILRILGERKKKVLLPSLKAEIEVSPSFVSKAIRNLEKSNLLQIKKNFVTLTGTGRKKSTDILKKHLILENYFSRTTDKQESHRKAHILEHYISEEVLKTIEKLYTLKDNGIPLLKLGLHKKGLIVDITFPDNELFERIVSMGILPGETIEITNKIPDGIVIKLQNKKFVLDKTIAQGIECL